MLERDLYLLVCLAFNHWHTGIEDPLQYPQCILAIHSSKRLLVEQIAPPPFLLADAIISLTITKGQRHEGREGMTAYYLTKVRKRSHSIEINSMYLEGRKASICWVFFLIVFLCRVGLDWL